MKRSLPPGSPPGAKPKKKRASNAFSPGASSPPSASSPPAGRAFSPGAMSPPSSRMGSRSPSAAPSEVFGEAGPGKKGKRNKKKKEREAGGAGGAKGAGGKKGAKGKKGKERQLSPNVPDEEEALSAAGSSEAEDSEGEYGEDEFGQSRKEDDRMKANLRVLLEHFDTDQMDRYEAYRRSGLAKASVRRLVNQVLGQSVSANVLTVVRGFAKVFVGEMVEKARQVGNHDGSLTPDDLREAYRLYKLEHQTPGKGTAVASRKKMFVK